MSKPETYPVSIRLTLDEIDLLEQIGAVLGAKSGAGRLSRAATVKALMARVKPGDGADSAGHREAYRKVHG